MNIKEYFELVGIEVPEHLKEINLSEKRQLEAVKENGNAIEYIDNPSEEVQLEAIIQNPECINVFKKEWFTA